MRIDHKTQAKHWAGKDSKIIQSYWDSPPATKRSKWFVEQLKNYEFDSIFEVGFFAGRNLRYIAEAFPDVRIAGLEVNPKAVKFARDKLGEDTALEHLSLHDLHKSPRIEDIVFTSGVLIHVPPENIKNAIRMMIGKTQKYIMHLEQIGNNEVTAGPKHLKPTYKVSDQVQWAPDLIKVYEELSFTPEIIELPKDCKTNGASELLIIRLY